MTGRVTAYQLAVQLFDECSIPSFPVLLSQDQNGKWQKQPLVKWGEITRNTCPGEFNWRRANAIGVPMGRRSGLFTFDVDSYKAGCAFDAWAEKHVLPPTRTHGTTSGGRHLIYRMPNNIELGNHAPKVHGVDVRGSGGFIVWADTLGRYSVIDPQDPATMPRSIIDELSALNSGAARCVHDAELPRLNYVDDVKLKPKLDALLADPLRWGLLAQRFSGATVGLKDKSRSSMDMSVAHMLAKAGFGYDEIALILLQHFPHGKAGRDGWTDAVERECCRCAWRAVSQRDESRRLNVERMQESSAKLTQLLLAGQRPEGQEGRQ